MNPQRHARIKDIFLRACEVPPERRDEFLAAASAGDRELADEVRRLLARHEPGSIADRPARVASSTTADPRTPRLATGTIVAHRYRIVTLLGAGGMGKVYRAEDLTLGRTVALKFLTIRAALVPAWRRRFEAEVRLAREVTHPYVCRVFDLGEHQGEPFISMEYVDGDNLKSLLRQVGRLTGDRARDIARQMCVGLAAAHARGVLHRDLKPANVMLDAKGHVRITDFGLSAIAGEIDPTEVRAGTPRYMAPEQLAGTDSTERSDIYSLGLVLYEMYCGRPAFSADSPRDYLTQHQSVQPVPPSAVVPDLDPAMESVILACIRKQPDERPNSALAVAAAIPGSDLLAAALEAGQVPPPEMVAEAESARRTRPPALRAMLAGTAALLALATCLGGTTHPITARATVAPELLLEKARGFAQLCAGPATPETEWCRFGNAVEYECRGENDNRQFALAVDPPGDPIFFYRAARRPRSGDRPRYQPFDPSIAQTLNLDARPRDGVDVAVDLRGRLLLLESGRTASTHLGDSVPPTDWSALIRAAGIDPDTLRQAPPRAVWSFLSDARTAFAPPPADTADAGWRIEAASAGGRPCWFAVLRELPTSGPVLFAEAEPRRELVQSLRRGLLLLLLIAAAPAAWRNWRAGDVDTLGAMRLGATILALRLGATILSARQLYGLSAVMDFLAQAALAAMAEGLVVVMFYAALERHVRTLWPHALIAWRRVLIGRIRDGRVGRDVLVGCLFGALWAVLVALELLAPHWLGWRTREPVRLTQAFDYLIGTRFVLAGCADWVRSAIYSGLLLMLLVVLTRIVVRRALPAAMLTWLICSALYVPLGTHPLTAWLLIGVGGAALAVLLLLRFGLVSLVVAIGITKLLVAMPLSLDLRAWHSGFSVFAVGLAAAVAVIGYRLAARTPTPIAS